MRLRYSGTAVTSTLLLCFSTALSVQCASQETTTTTTTTTTTDTIHLLHTHTPLNESLSLGNSLDPGTTIDRRGRGLFSRNNEDHHNKPPVKGPVQIAFEQRKVKIGEGSSGEVWEVKDGYPVAVGHKIKRVRAVIKSVSIRSEWGRKWMSLELVYLQTVGQLLGHGWEEENKRHHVVMPYMGMKLSKAYENGFPEKEKEEKQELANELTKYYEDKYGIQHLDVIPSNMVVRKAPPNSVMDWLSAPFRSKTKSLWNQPELKEWQGYLIDWGYAKFNTQKDMPQKFQYFSPEC